MTLEAPLHLQRRRLVCDRHLIDPAMARRAPDPFVHMNAVIEIRVVRQIVNPDPFHWLACAQTGSHRFKIGTVRPNLFVAPHAGFSGRHTSKRGVFDRAVAVAAVNAVVADVMLMTKLNWLLALDPRACVPGRSVEFSSNPERGQQDEDCAKNA